MALKISNPPTARPNNVLIHSLTHPLICENNRKHKLALLEKRESYRRGWTWRQDKWASGRILLALTYGVAVIEPKLPLKFSIYLQSNCVLKNRRKKLRIWTSHQQLVSPDENDVICYCSLWCGGMFALPNIRGPRIRVLETVLSFSRELPSKSHGWVDGWRVRTCLSKEMNILAGCHLNCRNRRRTLQRNKRNGWMQEERESF